MLEDVHEIITLMFLCISFEVRPSPRRGWSAEVIVPVIVSGEVLARVMMTSEVLVS